MASLQRELHLDGETKSVIDLPDVGAHVYFEHPTTDVWCVAYAFADDEPELWTPGMPCPPAVEAHIAAGGIITAWNAAFERLMARLILSPRYGWPEVEDRQWRCTMTESLGMNMPAKLEKAAPAFGLQLAKDEKGHRLMMQMCRPRKPRKDEDQFAVLWWDDAERRQRLYDYCKQDVRVEAAIGKRTLKLMPSEERLYLIDMQINDRGLLIDQPLCCVSQKLVQTSLDNLDKEIHHISGGDIASCNATTQLRNWLKSRGVETESVDKEHVEDLLLRDDIPADCRRALEIRQEGSKTSTAKLGAMLDRCADDGRVKGNFQFYGAGQTHRWAGRGVQFQNMTRPVYLIGKGDADAKIKEAIASIYSGDTVMIEMIYGQPMTLVADCVRSMVVAAPGFEFTASDLSNIEGRVVAWLAGQEDKLDDFRAFDEGNGPDLYLVAASAIYSVGLEEALAHRQIGKVAELSCLAADTQVLTDSGYKAITEVCLKDKLWDGVSWVHHQGLVKAGVQSTISFGGVSLTRDHLILTGRTWKPAHLVASSENEISLALAVGSENLPSWVLNTEQRAVCSPLGFNAAAVLKLIKPSSIIYFLERVHGVTHALRKKLVIGESSTTNTRISFLTRGIVGGYWAAFQQLLTDAIIRATAATITTASVGSTYTTNGALIEKRFLDTSPRWKDGTRSIWKWTGLKSIKATNRETFVSSRINSTRGIDEKRATSNDGSFSLKPVYDIARAGPNNRFTIKTHKGHLIVHNCGYQGGPRAFAKMSKNYGVRIAELYDGIWENTEESWKEMALDAWEERGKSTGLSERGWKAAEVIKLKWRAKNYRIKEYWSEVEEAAITGVENPGEIVSAGAVKFRKVGSFLFCMLPSGTAITYPYPKLKWTKTPWETNKRTLVYKSLDNYQWKDKGFYGGLGVENITQKFARDVMAHKMPLMEEAGYPIVLHAHDELVAETPAGFGSLEEFNSIMATVPEWAPGLPLSVGGWRGTRYRK